MAKLPTVVVTKDGTMRCINVSDLSDARKDGWMTIKEAEDNVAAKSAPKKSKAFKAKRGD